MPERTSDDATVEKGVRVSDSLLTIFSSLPRTKRKDEDTTVDSPRNFNDSGKGGSLGYRIGDTSTPDGHILKPKKHVSF